MVRVKDPEADPDSVCTGFFIDDSGYLITAFHSMKHRFLVGEEDFDLTIEFDTPEFDGVEFDGAEAEEAAELGDGVAGAGATGLMSSVTVAAHARAEWCDPKADWALLKVDYSPAAYLPLNGRGRASRDDLSDAELHVYGFTMMDQSSLKLALFKGNYVRHMAEKRRHHISYVVRAEGQSGGPVMNMANGEIIGSVVGYREREVMTGEAAELDRETVTALGLGIDLRAMAHEWHARAARFITARNPTLAVLAEELSVPELPNRFLRGREIVETIETLLGSDLASVFVHGAAGSGKTSVCVEAAHDLAAQDPGTSIVRYDFSLVRNRSSAMLIQALSMHLLVSKSCFEPIRECLESGFLRDHSKAAVELLHAVRTHRVIMIVENLHAVADTEDEELLKLLVDLESAAKLGRSKVLFNSHHQPPMGIGAPVVEANGFAGHEIAEFLRLYDVETDHVSLGNIAKLATNILCVEEVARSPEWRRKVLDGQDGPAGTEKLQRYWIENYARLPERQRGVLLAVAVMDRPVSRVELEEISDVDGFSATFEKLQRNPPLIRTSQEGYYIHSDTRMAMLTSSDRRQVYDTRLRAAHFCREKGSALEGARLLVQSEALEDALELLYQRRESLIASGSVDELEQVLGDIVERAEKSAELRKSVARELNILQASCSTMRGEYSAARQHWAHAAQTTQVPGEKAALLRRLGDSCRLASDYDAAIRHYQEAAALVEGASDHAELNEFAWASLGLGKLDRLHADYAQALERYGNARDSYSTLFDRTGLAEAEFGIGEVNRLLGAWGTSETAYASSLEHADSIGNVERRAYALWGLGEVCRLTGRFDAALDHHRVGLELCLKLGDRRSEGWALLGIGQAEFAAERMESARAAYEEALEQFEKTKSSTEVAHARLSLAELRSVGGETDLGLYDAADAHYRGLSLKHCMVQSSLAKALALRRLGRHRDANSLLKQAQKLAKKYELGPEERMIDVVRGRRGYAPALALNFP
ncbi:hypothetical protein GCM10009839_19020 [Catenulispora yoronensis]|uniref:Uncharacterized protein n=1 Tax=Catenulispora yoronensis TaxID=450799 RepID=A0ABP5FAR1_9ACTN